MDGEFDQETLALLLGYAIQVAKRLGLTAVCSSFLVPYRPELHTAEAGKVEPEVSLHKKAAFCHLVLLNGAEWPILHTIKTFR